jgi:TPR repeat protein
MYENGWGVEQSHAEALEWFGKAADQGNGRAQVNLGLMYENGRGVKQRVTRMRRSGLGRRPISVSFAKRCLLFLFWVFCSMTGCSDQLASDWVFLG